MSKKYATHAEYGSDGTWSGGFLRRRTSSGTKRHDWKSGFVSKDDAHAWGAERLNEYMQKKRTKTPPIRMECMGGCGKYQMISPSKIDKSVQFYGCGKCEGYLKAKEYALANRADGVHMFSMFGCIGGFHGWKMCLSTPEDEAAFARARAIRDAGITLLKTRSV
jgi:Protein of unknown function (DUF3622)